MPKLLRIHFSGFGHPSARLHPLTLDFRGPDGLPTDSAVLLRNGGGKTSVLSLTYAALLPHKRDFLGKVNNTNRAFADYFLGKNKLGVAVVEFCSENDPMHTFALLRASVLREREEDDSRFFYFRTGPDGIPFATLPIVGLASPAPTTKALSDWLWAEHHKRPGTVELVEETGFNQWLKRLSEHHIDPQLFRTHLLMNRAEGAADEVFSFNNSAKFLEFFFGMVIDPPRTDDNESDPVTKAIEEMRRSVQDMPKLQATVRFTERILQPMRDLVAASGEYDKTREEAAQIRAKAAAFRAGINAKITVLTQERQAEQQALNEADGRLNSLGKDLERIKGYVNSYDHWARKLRYEECLARKAAADQALALAVREARIHRAASEWRAIQEINSRVTELTQQIEKLRQDHRPELLDVCRAAWACFNTYQLAIEESDEQGRQAGAQAAQAATDLAKAEKARNDATQAQAKSEAIVQQLNRLISEAEQERRRLREELKIIDAHETPEAAKARWEQKKQSHDCQINALKQDTAELQRRRGAVERQLDNLSREIQSLELRAAADQQYLDEYENERRRCEKDPKVSTIINGRPLDPHNPGVAEQLRADARGEDAEKEKLVVLNAENVRTLSLHDTSDATSLLPPPVEIEALVARLITDGVRTAQAGYRWLSHAYTGAERLTMLQKHPEIAAGIVVQTPEDLAKAREMVTATVARPVFVGYTGALLNVPAQARVFHAVMPEEQGYFDPAAARLARPGIEELVKTNKSTIQDHERNRDACRSAADAVKALAEKFSMDRLRLLRESVASFREQLQSKESVRNELVAERNTGDARIAQNNEQLEEEGRLSQQAYAAATSLHNFIQHHWTKYPENVAKKDHESRAISDRRVEIDQCEQAIATATSTRDGFTAKAAESRDETLRLKTERKLRIGQEYLAEDQRHGDLADSITVGLTRYQTSQSNYEGKIQRGEIDGRLREATEQHAARETAFTRQYPQIDVKRVKALIGRADLDPEILRTEKDAEDQRNLVSQAKTNLDTATRNRPEPIPHHERLSLPQGFAEPKVSDEAETAKAQQKEQQTIIEGQHATARDARDQKREQLARTQATISAYKTTAEVLQMVEDDAATAEPATLSGENGIDTEKAKALREVLVSVQRVRDANSTKRDRMAATVLEILSAPEFARAEIEAQRKLAEHGLESLKRPAPLWVGQIEDLKAASENKLAERVRVHDSLLNVLDTQAKIAEARLGDAQLHSRMPTSPRLGEWSGRHFLRTNLIIERDQKVRRERLSALIDEWTRLTPEGKPLEATIPSGAKLAYKCFMALYDPEEKGLVRLQILKPEIALRLDYKPVEHLAKFSGGERVTAAIILYCIAVRVRGASQALHLDCGFLMLDNPLAKSNHSKLLNMQRLMARELGVQLIYYTGINDRDALNEFPHHIRLRNNRLDPKSGSMFLEAVSDLPALQSAVLGVDLKKETGVQHAAS